MMTGMELLMKFAICFYAGAAAGALWMLAIIWLTKRLKP